MQTKPSPVIADSSQSLVASRLDRRTFLSAAAKAAAAAALFPSLSMARDWSGQEVIRYPDPDIVVLDPRFDKYKLGNTAIQRLHTGALWAEGCAWNGVGRYLVWSDIPNNRQFRWLDLTIRLNRPLIGGGSMLRQSLGPGST